VKTLIAMRRRGLWPNTFSVTTYYVNCSLMLRMCNMWQFRHYLLSIKCILINYLTSTVVFYRTLVYQMQPRNGQNWHSFVGKTYVNHSRETAKICFCTSLKSISISGFVDIRVCLINNKQMPVVYETTFPSRMQSFMENGKELRP